MTTLARSYSIALLILCAICMAAILDATLLATTDLTEGWRTFCCALMGFGLGVVWPRAPG